MNIVRLGGALRGRWGLALIVAVASVVVAGGCKRGRRGHTGAQGDSGEGYYEETEGLYGTVQVEDVPEEGYFEEGDQVRLVITVTDDYEHPVDITTENLSRARLYIYGPIDQLKTEACQGLMRTALANEYIHLDLEHEGLAVDGNVAVFETGEITDEEPGTYRAMVWLASATETWARCVVTAEFQIKTDVPETDTVAATQCAPCHQGTETGQFYFAHTDVSAYSTTGIPELDNSAVAGCKACHNQAGYSNTTDTWSSSLTKIPDPLVRRVHGVHVGEELKNPRNTHRMAVAPVAPADWSGLNPQGLAPYVGLGMIHGVTSGAHARINNSDGGVTGATWFGLGHIDGEFLIGETIQVIAIRDLTKTSYNLTDPLFPPAAGTDPLLIGTATILASTVYDSAGTAEDVAVQEGYFADYTTVVFPPDARNCTKCHVDDNWRTKPTQQACGACHDNIWWGDDAATPPGFKDHEFEIGDIVAGVAGSDRNPELCNGCHSDAAYSVAEAHEVPEYYLSDQSTPAPEQLGGGQEPYAVEVSMSAPLNGTYYTVGESPKIYVKTIDHTVSPPVVVPPASITQSAPGSWSAHALYVSGPRHTKASPVLTSAAVGPQLSSTCTGSSPYATLLLGDTFNLTVNGVAYALAWPGGANTAADVVAWLNAQVVGVPAFNTVIKAVVSSGKVQIKSKTNTPNSMIDFGPGGPSTLQTKMGFPTGRLSLPSTYGNDLRVRTDAWDADPRVTWGTDPGHPDEICYQLDPVDALEPGTYHFYVDVMRTARPDGFAMMTFQVKTDTPSAYIATNCADCHGDRHMHLDAGGRHPVDFSLDYCKNCHDYKREQAALDVWAAYGADPIVKKVHGIHRGHYLQYPEKIYVNNPIWGGIIFPQDVRNCTKCHSSDTTGTWATAPSRLACGSCHDTDSDEAHMLLQTLDPTPTYDAITKLGGPWSGDETESCEACHGEDKEFSPDKVHKIKDPYVPPYPR